MKRAIISFILTALLLSLAHVGTVRADTNPVKNPGFEEWTSQGTPSYWTSWGDVYKAEPPYVHSGSYALGIGHYWQWDLGYWGQVAQQFPAVAGKGYKLGMWVQTYAYRRDMDPRYLPRVIFSWVSSTRQLAYYEQIIYSPSQWSYIGWDLLIAPAGTVTAQIVITNSYQNYGPPIYIDDVVFEEMDVTPPITTISLDPPTPNGNEGWYTSNVQVTLIATDDGGSGVAKIEYSLDGTNWNTYTAPFALSDEGTTTVYYRSIDTAGNLELFKKEASYVQLDLTPVFNSDAYSPGQCYCSSGCTYPTNPGTIYTDPVYGAVPMDMKPAGVPNVWLSSGYDRTYPFPTSLTLNTNIFGATNFWVVGLDGGWYPNGVEIKYILDGQQYSTTFYPNDWCAPGTGPNLKLWVNRNGACGDIAVARLDLPRPGKLSQITIRDLTGAGTASIPVFAVTVRKINEPFNFVTIKIDKTKPSLTFGAVTPAPNAAGWNKSDVSIAYTANDNLSGVTSATPTSPLTFTAEGAGLTQTVTISDKAGNSATFTSPAVNIDKTSPTLTFGVASPAPNAAGWNNTNVSVPFTAGDTLSGVASTNPASSPLVLAAEGSAVSGAVTVTDVAGNTANFTTATYKIDKTPPIITATRTPEANASGWNNSDVTVRFSASDNLSEIASVTPDIILSSEGANQSATGTATDLAGNQASITISGINIDETKPSLTFGAVTPAPNAAGWNDSNVTIAYTVSDNLSGIASTVPASPLSFTTEGANLTQTVTVTDKAGNSDTFISPKVNLDKTRPVVTVTSPQAKDYQTSESLALDLTTSDALSGLASTAATLDGNPVASGQVINLADMAGNHTLTVSAIDKAGNFQSLSVTFSVIISAGVDIDPDTINLKSQSDKNAITAYIELPAGYDVGQINVAAVKLRVSGIEIATQLKPTSVGDYDKDGVADLMVKFDRQAVIAALAGKTGDIRIAIIGQLGDGRPFDGEDTIKVINPGK